MDRRTLPGTSLEAIADSAQGWPWKSAAMRDLEDDIACAINSDETVMITGESGAGRKFIAHLIHQRSRRGLGPFVVTSWPDAVEPLPESSASEGRPACESADRFTHGRLMTANNGTLLLEEIEAITLPMQSELMGFVESQTTTGRNVRLVSATGTDFFERVRSNQFREDLYYRLNVIHLAIPALRDRPEDIPALVRHYLSFYRRAEVPRLSIMAWRKLVAYRWPGNVPELKTVAKTLAEKDLRRLVEPEDLPPEIGG
jgi:two-component system nitrogen regulation response regulator GlnG